MRTYQAGKDIKRRWHLFDAKDEVLGRLSSQIAYLLVGKSKVDYSPNLDQGDYVVIVNAEKVKLTGRKESQKVYYHHSGHPGGFSKIPVSRMRAEHPERIIEHAVAGMIPDNKLKKERMKRLKIVVGSENPFKDKIGHEVS